MRVMDEDAVYSALYEGIKDAGVILPRDVSENILKHQAAEEGLSKTVLTNIVDNLECAKKNCMPMCQDTGMVLFFVEIGRDIILNGVDLDQIINRAVEDAYRDASFRKSVVKRMSAKKLFHSSVVAPPASFFRSMSAHVIFLRLRFA